MKRQDEISYIVDTLHPTDYFTTIFNKYSKELNYYKLIKTIEEFSLLKLKGSLRYINKFTCELRYGGLLIKIFFNYNKKKWYGIIKNSQNKKYYVSFDSNYIFYCENIGEIYENNFRNGLDIFITDIESGKYHLV
jgi:hypothetical protein